MDLRPFEFAVPHQWTLAETFAPCLDFHVTLNEVARATLESLDCRMNSLAHVVQYNLYCDGSYTPPAFAITKRPGTIQNAGWAFIIAAQYSPRVQDEVIVWVAAGPMIQGEMDQQGLQVQSAETSEAFALHQSVKWAFSQPYPVTILLD